MSSEPPFSTYAACGQDDRCRDNGCPFDGSDDAPANCALRVEAAEGGDTGDEMVHLRDALGIG